MKKKMSNLKLNDIELLKYIDLSFFFAQINKNNIFYIMLTNKLYVFLIILARWFW